MNTQCLVTGANGHLGNNLVRALIEAGYKVRAGIRKSEHTHTLEGLACEVAIVDILNPQAVANALKGIDTLYHVAAVFQHWAKNPQVDIVQANIQSTGIVLKAAAQAKVKKIIYVSSIAAVGHAEEALNEQHWNEISRNAYYNSKILSERRAWDLAKTYNLCLVCVQPSSMIGPYCHRLTDTMNFLQRIKQHKLILDPNFHFNFVDVRDVAQGMIQAYKLGSPGERYILANQHSSSVSDIIRAFNEVYPEYRSLPKAPKSLLLVLSNLMQLRAKITGQPAELIKSQVHLFYKIKQEYDISKAQHQLSFLPRSPKQSLMDTLIYLRENHND